MVSESTLAELAAIRAKKLNSAEGMDFAPKSGLESALIGDLQGGTFGWGEEAVARILSSLPDALTPESIKDIPQDQRYETLRDYGRQSVQQAAQDNPLSYLGGNVAGTLAVGSKLPLAAAKGFVPAVGAGLAYGGIYGGGESNADIGTSAFAGDVAKGAALGGGVSAAFQAGSKLIQSKPFQNFLSDEAGSFFIPKVTAAKTAEEAIPKLTNAEGAVYRALLDTGMTHDDIVKELGSWGKGNIPLTGAEKLASTKLDNMQRSIAQSSGKGADTLNEFAQSRFEALPATLGVEVQKNIGKIGSLDVYGQQAKDVASNIINSAKNARSEAVKPQYAEIAPLQLPEDKFNLLLDKNPLMKDTFGKIKNDVQFKQRLADASENLGFDIPENSIAYVDQAKKHLDGLIETAKRTGESTDVLASVKNKLTKFSDAIYPKYGEVRAQYAGMSPEIDTMQNSIVGLMAKTKEGDYNKIIDKIFNSSPDQIKYARDLFANNGGQETWNGLIASKIAKIGDDVNHSPLKFINAVKGSRDAKFTSALLPEQKDALNTIADTLKKAAKIKYGSDTQRNIMGTAAFNSELSGGAEKAIGLAANVGKAIKAPFSAATDAYEWMAGKVQEGKYSEVADILTGKKAVDLANKLNALGSDDAAKYTTLRDALFSLDSPSPITKALGVEAAGLAGKSAPDNKLNNNMPPPMSDLVKEELARIRGMKNINPKVVTGAGVGLGGAAALGGQDAQAQPLPPQSFNLPQDIQQAEGVRHAAYTDTTGNRTIGYGFNLDSGIAPKIWKKAGIATPFDDVYGGAVQISDAEAKALGNASYEIAMNDAQDVYTNLSSLPKQKQAALLNLSYNLGKPKLKEFAKFNAAVNSGRWKDAARELLRSKYKTQTGNRANEIARALLA